VRGGGVKTSECHGKRGRDETFFIRGGGGTRQGLAKWERGGTYSVSKAHRIKKSPAGRGDVMGEKEHGEVEPRKRSPSPEFEWGKEPGTLDGD